MEILRSSFPDTDTAMMSIRDGIMNFYISGSESAFTGPDSLIEKSITALQNAYRQNVFPGMKVTYDVYPDHIGHLESEGCFRCHNDLFVSESGRRITKDCNLCHTIIGQGQSGKLRYSTIRDTLEFEHPVDIGTAWLEANCSECHKYLY